MVSSCSVQGCVARQNAESKGKGIWFFSFPRGKRQRTEWIKATDRKDKETGGPWQPGPGARICSRHFEEGWMSDDPKDTNYRPTLFLKPAPVPAEPADKTSKRKHGNEGAEIAKKKPRRKEEAMKTSVTFHPHWESHRAPHHPAEDGEPGRGGTRDASVMTEESAKSFEELEKEVGELKKEVADLRWSYRKMENDDAKTKFYTGLPTFPVFMWLYSFLEAKARVMTYRGRDDSSSRPTSGLLPLIDQLFATLMRLRLGLFLQDLADRFQMSSSAMSTIVTTWIFLLHKELEALNPCPSKATLRQTMPPQFCHLTGLRFFLDCTEVRVESPSGMPPPGYPYSKHKRHTAAKFLVAISPTGLVTFISDAWEGGASDREITQRSGFLDLLESGDLVLADKGFAVSDLVTKRGAFLNIPPFLVHSPFAVREVYMSAKVRSHVGRAVSRVKQYHILNGVLPSSLKNTLGSIFKVCCWLSNLQEPLGNPS